MSTIQNGWERLSSGFDVEFRNSIPYRLSDNGKHPGAGDATLAGEITTLAGLDVQVGNWVPGTRPAEHEARLYVSSQDFSGVLRRLAQSAAALFVDRYHKPIDDSDVDWDRLEYLRDFHAALEHCGLEQGDIDQNAYRDIYVEAMHQATQQLVQSLEPPLVEPE